MLFAVFWSLVEKFVQIRYPLLTVRRSVIVIGRGNSEQRGFFFDSVGNLWSSRRRNGARYEAVVRIIHVDGTITRAIFDELNILRNTQIRTRILNKSSQTLQLQNVRIPGRIIVNATPY